MTDAQTKLLIAVARALQQDADRARGQGTPASWKDNSRRSSELDGLIYDVDEEREADSEVFAKACAC